MTPEEQNCLAKGTNFLKRKGSFAGEPSKKARVKEIPIVSIQIAPILESDAAAPSLALPDEATPSTSLEWEEVAKKRNKKEKNIIAKKIKRKVGRSNGESSG
ncbi:hypothetical protein COCNU_13G008000 [Cocos nucifera]|uniref:Uncharacterized protein n=1 Tax=Cocos nucifera TaxID=13894 RepID=A0A8K0ITT2_COCNU|nr:hypothetical protein COCNU_13G008000 [Cocos nucifera]